MNNNNINNENIGSFDVVVKDNTKQIPESIKNFATTIEKTATDLYAMDLRRTNNNVDPNEILKNRNIDRLASNYTGSYQKGIQKERSDLYNQFLKTETINYVNGLRPGVQDITSEDANCFRYLPNSRLSWLNKVVKAGLVNGISKCDYSAALKISLNETSRKQFEKILNKMVRDELKDFTYTPINKLGTTYTCIDNEAKVTYRNPGIIDNDKEHCNCDDNLSKADNLFQYINDLEDELISKLDIHENTKIFDDNSVMMEPKIRKLFVKVRDDLIEGHLSNDKIEELSNALEYIRQKRESKYLLSILDPFLHRHAKIPTQIPVPSSTFSLRSNFNLTTNASGNVAFAFNPFYLTTSGDTALYINNGNDLTGAGVNMNFLGVNVGQSMPLPLYSKYRVVSSAIKLTFTSSLLNSTGFSTMGYDYADIQPVQPAAYQGSLGAYGNFQNIENTYFKTTMATRNGDNLQINYIPLDESFRDYKSIGDIKTGIIIVGYVSGAPQTSTVARADLVINYEAIVSNLYTDYLPCQIYTGNLEDLTSVSRTVATISNNNLSASPTDIKNSMHDQQPNMSYDIGKSTKFAEKDVDNLQNLANIKSEIARALSEPKTKNSMLQKVMEYTNPIASTILNKGIDYIKGRFNFAPFGKF